MSWMDGKRKFWRACGLAGAMCLSPLVGWGQDTSPPPPDGVEVPVSAGPLWKMPELAAGADVEKLRAFIKRVKRLQPTTPEQFLEMHRVVRETSLKILQGSSNRESPEFREAEVDYVSSSVMLLGNANDEAPQKTFDRFRDYLQQKKKLTQADLQMCLLAGQNLEQVGDRELVRNAYSAFASIIAAKEDESLQSFVNLFEANIKRLDLPGTELRLQSPTLGGKAFDLAELRGKVVVLYVFATWSQPSVSEIAVMTGLRKELGDKPVQFVGVSLDSDRGLLEKFLKQAQIDWPILWDEGFKGAHPLATDYGIMLLPTTILVDQQGVVQGLEAGTRTLKGAIEHLLQPAEPKAAEPDASADPEASKDSART